MHRHVLPSSSLQPISVKWISPVSSSSSLTRQQRPQPSHRLSHSATLISSSVLTRQNGSVSWSLAVIGSAQAFGSTYDLVGLLACDEADVAGSPRAYVRFEPYASLGRYGE